MTGFLVVSYSRVAKNFLTNSGNPTENKLLPASSREFCVAGSKPLRSQSGDFRGGKMTQEELELLYILGEEEPKNLEQYEAKQEPQEQLPFDLPELRRVAA
jgi:hypothetical protein